MQLIEDLIRCDQKADCDDQSDETSCQIVYVNPKQYLKVSYDMWKLNIKQYLKVSYDC